MMNPGVEVRGVAKMIREDDLPDDDEDPGARYDPCAYETNVTPGYRPIAEELARRSSVRREEDVLEVGAGTGLLTRLLVPTGCKLIATDISGEMLRYARQVLVVAAQPCPPMVSATITALPFADRSFDVIVANLTPLQDTARAIREAIRVIRTDGRISLSMWGPSYSESRLHNLALRIAGKKHQPYGGPRIAVERFRRFGFNVERKDERFLVEHGSVDKYLYYRRAFGRPRSLSAAEGRTYYRALRSVLDQRTQGGPVLLDWNVTFLTVRRA